MDLHKLFDDKSDLYAEIRPRYPAELYRWLAGVSPACHTVWDVGCGSGQAAVDLRNYFGQVFATDVSPIQIANAPTQEGIHFSAQPAEKTTFLDHSFDAVCVAQALHWFDYDRFWPEVKRVLKPSGVFAAWGYSWPHVDSEIDSLLERSFLTVIQPYWANQNRLLWNGFTGIPLPFEPVDVPHFDLSMHWSVEQFFAFLHSWSATRRCMDARGDNFFNDSFEKIAEIWGDGVRKVEMDFFVVAGKNP